MSNITSTQESVAAVKETLGYTDSTIAQHRGDAEALSLAGVAGAITEIRDLLAAPRMTGCIRVPGLDYMADQAHGQLSNAMGGSSQPAVGEALDAITAMGGQESVITTHGEAADAKRAEIVAALGLALERMTEYDEHVALMEAGIDTAQESQQLAIAKVNEIQF
ncbi:MAG TPA: hypothetical protein VLH86_02590 [Patescibacteria group bacterium]|nr:hypothetical protein [Patescibacteria group bacterium]